MEESGNGNNGNSSGNAGSGGANDQRADGPGGEKRRRRRRRGGKGKAGGGDVRAEGSETTPRESAPRDSVPRDQNRPPPARDNAPPRDNMARDKQQNRPHQDSRGPQRPSGNASNPQQTNDKGPRDARGDKRRGGRDRNRNAKTGGGAGGSHPPREKGDKERLKKALAEISPKRLDLGDKPVKHEIRRYDMVLYDTFAAAKADHSVIAQKAQACDQLNVVIRAEGNMDDAELLGLSPKVKIFAGNAWTIIHERRKTDGWYDEPR